ncbi:uncharacterized protein LOC114543361 [Dendronephthya gigantea]|uniref:uncharacterized protein LOC114543361 n=1 Tax=Dendronephthya gigantea TaxID=151771 RepID=UPI00106CB960|nr:uncharacterized protein LOC114543361 [Dendronephthya gigantea]
MDAVLLAVFIVKVLILFSLVGYSHSSNFTESVTILTIAEGKASTLNCTQQEGRVLWKINGMPLTKLTDGVMNFQLGPNSTLMIRNPVHGGKFGQFNVTCTDNITNATFHVYLTKEPRLLSNNTLISVIENTVVLLNVDCSAEGYPKPSTWWKIGKNVLTKMNGTIKSQSLKHHDDNVGFSGTYRVLSNGSLSIHGSFKKAPSGRDYYTCIARNTIGNRSQSYSIEIEKLETYSFETILPPEQLVNLGKRVRDKVR